MTRTTDFGEFGSYVGLGLVIAFVVAFLGCVFAVASRDKDRDKIQMENNLYLALQGMEVQDSTSYDSTSYAVAKLLKTKIAGDSILADLLPQLVEFNMLSKVWISLLSEKKEVQDSTSYAVAKLLKTKIAGDSILVDLLPQLVEFNALSRVWINLLSEKKEKIMAAAKGDTTIALVSVPKWSTFWQGFVKTFYLLLALGATLNLVIVSIHRRESLLLWPWQKFWVYPSIIWMLPVLLPFAVLEVLYRLFTMIIRIAVWGLKRILRDRRSSRRQQSIIQQRSLQEKPKVRPLSFDERVAQKEQAARDMIEAARTMIEETKRNFVQFFLTTLTDRKAQLEGKVQSQRAALSKLGEKITETQRNLANAQSGLTECQASLDHLKTQTTENFHQELERLWQLPHVQAVEVVDGELRVFTDTIFIVHGLRKFKIGMFVIKINMTGDNIAIQNLSSTHPEGYFHPYARSGSICWGTLSDPIHSALYQKEFSVALLYILQAMQSAEGDNPQKVTAFKEVFPWCKD